ncbi:prolyl oligopeptidase family serine peptidase [Erythrobacter sp. W53]|uniref:dipeptidyl-peptidase 5 n=1 Tax=Erythrobacter sp. W53 TaxID=3425947 RepID=UPI003D767ABE
MIRHMRSALAFLGGLTLTATPLSADDHADMIDPNSTPMSAEDLITMPRLGSPIVSNDGWQAVYRVTETDSETFERTSTYYLVDLGDPSGAPIPLDFGINVHSLAFGPDDSLHFLSDHVGEEESIETPYTRLWKVGVTGGGDMREPFLVADIGGKSIDGFKLSPSGDKVALWAEIARDCPRFGCKGDGKKHLPGPGPKAGSGRLYDGDEGFVRHWDHWTSPGSYNRVFVFNLEDSTLVGHGTALDGPAGEGALVAHTPTRPFGGGGDIAWAADGSGVYFTARQAGASEPTSTDFNIWWSDLSGNAPTNLTENNKAVDTAPTPSPDGKYLAYLAMERPGYESDRLVVHLRNLETGETRALTEGFDRSFGSLAWTPDSRYIIATAQDVLDTPAFQIDPRDGSVKRLDLMAGNEAHLGNITPLSGGRMLFTRDSIGSPAELYLSQGMGQARPLTDVARSRVGRLASIVVRRFNFAGANGDTVWGQITKLDNQAGPMPAILYIHGGPQGSFNDGWSSRWNPRVVASQGYAVISVDFHGSTGYGQEFTDAINKDWGGKPLEDLQKGLAAALEIDTQIDGTRACAMGASYGGYMVNWIAGKWPDRFKCLIQHDGLFDMRSFYYTTEELWFPRWDFGGSYAEARDEYERWNPANHVGNWQTPMLVVTGEQDFRVPYTQGIASFTALQERGIPSQLLVFPDENHWVLGAKNSLQWHNTVFNWLDRWLKEDESAEQQ